MFGFGIAGDRRIIDACIVKIVFCAGVADFFIRRRPADTADAGLVLIAIGHFE